ncbi:hypothetical protein pb186bvf_005035 [Paramecium bursaria]
MNRNSFILGIRTLKHYDQYLLYQYLFQLKISTKFLILNNPISFHINWKNTLQIYNKEIRNRIRLYK